MTMGEAPASEVAAFYKERSILVTGGTGFMGKVLLEKLLYECHDLRSIYVLVRPKREKGPQTRLEEMIKLPVFQRLRQEHPEALKKLIFVHGDIQSEGLGLNDSDINAIRRHVSIVFHCAATLRLEAKLKDAVHMNLMGTWNVLTVCKTLPHLQVLVHLSTAFCHCDLEEMAEQMYPCPYDPHDIMRCVQWMDEGSLDKITPKLIQPHPNTYTFTKRLAEVLVSEQYPDLPVVIARPSIVTPAWKEPVPGWVDSLNGPVGLLVGAGKGVIRSMHCRGELHSEVIPVDIAINGLISLAAKEGARKERASQMPVYNLTAGEVKRMTWAQVLERGRKVIYENPFEMTIWYPDGNIRSSKLMHDICSIFLHFLPAYFIDFLLFIFRQKRFMVRIQRRIKDGLDLLQYFTTREWAFRSKNFLSLYSEMNDTDKRKFNMDMEAVDENEYLKLSVLGARQFCLKEDLKSLPRCRRNMKILYVVDRVWSVCFYMLLLWFLISWSETAVNALQKTGSFIKSLPMVAGSVEASEL